MFHKMPLILALLIALVTLLDPLLPLTVKSFLYAISLSVKSLIIFVLPALIFMLLFKTIARLSKNATTIVLFILAAITLSNFCSTMISYEIGKSIYAFDIAIQMPDVQERLVPLFSLTLEKLIPNDVAMFSGLFLGLLGSLALPTKTAKLAERFETIVARMLKAITLLMPIFITGFVVKLLDDKILDVIAKHYAMIFCLVLLAVSLYIGLLFLAANGKKALQAFKNALPAAFCGFSSMSSAAALPLAIEASEKNCASKEVRALCPPLSVNIHLIGDCFAIPIFAFCVMKNFGVDAPAFTNYFVFSLYFVLAKFSVAAIPGGGIIVMLPILESYLGFSSEMASLITALYILFDPVITGANTLGNCAFVTVLDRLYRLFTPEKATSA